MKFVYPIDGIDGNVDVHLGSKNKRGFYPIGKQFNWHGGLHIGERTIKPIKAIADGVVIAYRVQKTSTKINEEDDKGYSTSFVLIQHEYISPKGRKFVFYSLYMNLLPKDKMGDDYPIPPMFLKKEFTVKGEVKVKDTEGPDGENLRSGPNYTSEIIGFRANGSSVTTVGEKQGSYYKVERIGDEKNVDHFIYADSLDSTFKVQGNQKKLLYKGAALKTRPNAQGHIENVKNGTKLSISGHGANYYNVEEVAGLVKKGLMLMTEVKPLEVSYLEDSKLNRVISGNECNIPVKAGAVIGFSSPSVLSVDSNYKAAHIEVFTDQNPTSFITGEEGDKNDKADTLKYLKLSSNKKLTLKCPLVYKIDDVVKVLNVNIGKLYCEIRLQKQVRIVPKSDLKDYSSTAKTYKPKNLSNLQAVFKGLQADSALTWIESLDKDGDVEPRKVSHTLSDNYPSCWVKREDLKEENGKRKKDITGYYEEPTDTNLESTVLEDIILSEPHIKEITTDNENFTWYKLKVQDKEGYKEGYIKKSDLSAISAHDWTAFGFKISALFPKQFLLSAEDSYLNMIWKQLDKTGAVDKPELTRALENQVTSRKLSKLICCHDSEWGLDYSNLEREVTAYFDKCIEQAEGATAKAAMEDQKPAKLDALKEKMKNLDFWKDVKVVVKENVAAPATTVATTTATPSATTTATPSATQTEDDKQSFVPFPTSPKVYHFHPIAFVEQMRMVNVERIGYVDWDFIKAKEGKEVLTGYVPTKIIKEKVAVKDKNGNVLVKEGKEVTKTIDKTVVIGKSGVTIASGFDIGQHNSSDIKRIFGNNAILKNKYLPYVGKKKQIAVDYLKDHPITITEDQAKLTDKLIKESQVNSLIKVYNRYNISREFKYQSIGIQTVIMSIAFQYGVYSRTLNKMWKALESNNDAEITKFWEEKAKGKAYKKRRKSELDYLKEHINDFK